MGPKAPTHVGVRYSLLQLRYLGFQKVVRDDQRANGRTQIAVANGDRLVNGGFQPIVLFVRLRDRGRGTVPVDPRWRMFLFCSYEVKGAGPASGGVTSRLRRLGSDFPAAVMVPC